MLKRVALTPEQAQDLKAALEREEDGLIQTENSVNLTTLMGFLSTRYLPVPRIQAHGRVEGDGYENDFMLMRGRDGFVVLEQRAISNDQPNTGPSTVIAFPVLASALPFALESRQRGWPLRIRSLLMDVVEWTLEEGKEFFHGSGSYPGRSYWDVLRDSQSHRLFDPDIEALREVLQGKRAVREAWAGWAQDEAQAVADFVECQSMRQTVEKLVGLAPSKPRP